MTKQLTAYFYPSHMGQSIWYVTALPGEGGVDYGYSPNEADARPLNGNEFRSFAKYRRECGGVAYAVPAKGSDQ